MARFEIAPQGVGYSSGRVWKARLVLLAAVPPGSQDPLKGLGGGTHMRVASTMFIEANQRNIRPQGRCEGIKRA